MIKKVFFIILFFSLSWVTQAQDTIILKNNEVVPCFIMKANSTELKYQVTEGDRIKIYIMPTENVSYFSMSARNYTNSTKKDPFFRVALSLGYARRLARTQDDYYSSNWSKIEKDLFNGFSCDVEPQLFFNENYGIGFLFNGIFTESGTYPVNITGSLINIRAKQHFLFFGPSWLNRFYLEKFMITTNVALGAIFYNGEIIYHYGENNQYQDSFEKVGMGLNLGGGFEYKFSKYLAAGTKLSFTFGGCKIGNGYAESIKLSMSSVSLGGYISFQTK